MNKVEKVDFKKNDPLFNSGLAYLERIHKIMQSIHIYFQMNDTQSVYSLLNSLQIEIYPRLNELQQEEADKLRLNALRCINPKVPPEFSRMQLYNYFNKLNTFTHNLGLVMPNKPDQSEATEV